MNSFLSENICVNKTHMKAFFLFTICLLLAIPVYAQAPSVYQQGQFGRVYKWADERGNVHYTHYPPEYGTWSEIDPARPEEKGFEFGEAGSSGDEGPLSDEWLEGKKQGETMSARDIIDRNCVIARNNLMLLQNVRATQLTYTNDQGEKVKLEGERRAARIKAAQDNISHYCK